MQFLVWNLNDDTGIFWSEMSILEDNGFLDPWGQKINLNTAKKIRNKVGEVVQHELFTECEGYPVSLIIMEE